MGGNSENYSHLPTYTVTYLEDWKIKPRTRARDREEMIVFVDYLFCFHENAMKVDRSKFSRSD